MKTTTADTASASLEKTIRLVEGTDTDLPNLTLSSRVLEACRSVKVKRLFFFFADRHRHAWLKHLDKRAIDFGAGKRQLVEGGVLDPSYQITVPKDLDDVQ